MPGKTLPDDQPRHRKSQREAYHIVTDTVVGPNVRLKDNLYQGLAILVCLLIGAGIGALAVAERGAGAMVGGFAGLVIGLFGSGIFLMIFRALRHARGKHD